MSYKRSILVLVGLLAIAISTLGQTERRALRLDDLFRIKDVRDVQVSPDGKWVAYVVATTDVKADKSDSDIWMVSFDGKINRQITFSSDSETSPRWSPNGKYLSFVSSRPGPNKGSQLWLLDLGGGEAKQFTEFKGRMQTYEWSPDSKRMAMVIGDPDPDEPAAAGTPAKPPKPIVIDRYRYKQDGQGYLLSNRHSYIYLYDIDGKKLDRLTKGKADEGSPAWSPDGGRIAFVSDQSDDPDRDSVVQIFVADSRRGSVEKPVTPKSSRGTRSAPQWSPDGKTIAFLETDELAYGAYSMSHLTLVDSGGGAVPVRVKATEELDRGVSNPRYSQDGKSIGVLVTDNRTVYPVRVDLADSKTTRLMEPPVVISGWDQSNGRVAVLSSNNAIPTEVFSFDSGKLNKLTRHNDKLFSELNLGSVEDVGFKSKDGTDVYGLLTYPAGYVKGTKVPLLLRIHGGPNGQDQHSFSSERQFFAANGYAVLAINYRGSSGRGRNFSRAIYADWGNYEVMDLLAGVDHVIKMGVADPNKLGVGGWSYGGILTNYLIASDTRFKAGTSGAGTSFTIGFYGTDQYIHQYDNE
ncbi:MAG: S9 family peptidase, partial [Pyrinomonadaceae bacterium]